jgi:PDZ domain-containing protein
MSPRLRKILTALWVAAVLGTALFVGFVPLPYYSIAPGPARDIRPLIAVDGAPTYDSSGRFVMTTIEAAPLTAIGVVFAWIDPDRAVVDESVLYPPGLSAEEEERLAISDMDTSKINATYVVLEELTDYPREHRDGALISVVEPGCPADGELYPGDVITSIDGQRIDGLGDANRAFADAGPREPIAFEVTPLGTETSERVRFVRSGCGPDGELLVGIVMVPTFPIDVTIASGDVGGPSAGLMFAVTLYDLLTPGDLAAGRTIAGTGTIQADGSVGPIGGIEEKVVAARRAEADVLFVPAGNIADARRTDAEGVALVEVETFEDAIGYLLETGGEADTATRSAA